MCSFPCCLHTFQIKDASEFEFFSVRPLVSTVKVFQCFMVGNILWFYSSLDYIFIISNLCRKHFMLLIVLVSMCSWLTTAFTMVPPKRMTWEFVPLLHCTVVSLTHCLHVRISTFHQEDGGFFLLIVAEYNPSICFLFYFILYNLNWIFL